MGPCRIEAHQGSWRWRWGSLRKLHHAISAPLTNHAGGKLALVVVLSDFRRLLFLVLLLLVLLLLVLLLLVLLLLVLVLVLVLVHLLSVLPPLLLST